MIEELTITSTSARQGFEKSEDAPRPARAMRLAYLLSSYPAVSHTFFLNEIAELRKLGFGIDVASVNDPRWQPKDLPESVSREQQRTFYIKNTSVARVASILLTTLVLRPLVVLRGMRAALQLDPWNLPASIYAIFYLAEAVVLGDWLRQNGHRHLHIHFGGPVATVGMLTSAAWGISYSLTVHGPEEFFDVNESYLRSKVERASFVLCISDYCRSQVMKISDPVHWGNFHVVRLGVHTKHFTPFTPAVCEPELNLISVGRLVPAKGQLVLLRAFSNLVARGHRLRLRLIGDGENRGILESFVDSEHLKDKVFFEGALDHESTRRWLGQADIFVLPSFSEGLPVALMEAMVMEVPCVSTFVAGIPELIRDGMDGLLVPPSSEEALTDALERLILDPRLRRELSRSGRLRVLELYDLQRNVSQLAATLRALVPARG